jgi:hypothetical protein
MRLDELDRSLDETPGFRIVSGLKVEESGVDPIGLRQLNLDLMDATVPGINNVTQYIRPYTFMAWAWWRASQYVARHGVTPEAVHDLVERYEAIYAWSHSLAGMPFRGHVAVRKFLISQNGADAFTFAGAAWEGYKKERTSFMAPTEYGPSIKSLRFLKQEGGMFSWASEAMPAIHAIDAIVCSALPERLLRPKSATVRRDEVQNLALTLPVHKATAEETAVFRYLFHKIGGVAGAAKDMRRRKATIDLVRSILAKEGRLDIDGLRRRFAACEQVTPYEGDEAEIRNSAVMLCHLQARQLQRLATEAMMLWVEVLLSEKRGQPRTTDDIVNRMHECAIENDDIYSQCMTVGDYLHRVSALGSKRGWPAAAGDTEAGVVDLLSRIHRAQSKDLPQIPGLALRSFAVILAVTNSFKDTALPLGVFNSIESRPDRMPMGTMVRRLEALTDRPLPSLLKEIIESWIIGQHVFWSAIRGSDGKKRLRIGLEGDGWMLVRPLPSKGFAPTPDRLWTLLALGTACEIFNHNNDGSFGVCRG